MGGGERLIFGGEPKKHCGPFFSTGVIRCASGKRREREQAFTANNKERTASESTALHDGGSVEEEQK